MPSWKVVSWDGSTTLISAYTESDAYQQAVDFCGDACIKSFDPA
jgi:hypothetical protein